MTYAAFPWYGGKNRISKWILEQFPTHDSYQTYIEVFGGSGAVLLAKRPSPVEIYNDINTGVVNFFRVLRDPYKVKELKRLCSLTPYSREEFNQWCHYFSDSKTYIKDPTGDVDIAHKWFYIARSKFIESSTNQSWSYAIQKSSQNKSMRVSIWHNSIDHLDEIAQRFLDVQIECLDYKILIPKYDFDGAMFYLDPPYIAKSRYSQDNKYEYELKDIDEHRQLIDILLNIKGMAIISGYYHPAYNKLVKNGWQCKTRATFSSVANNNAIDAVINRSKRIECLWISPGINNQQISMQF